MFCPECRSEFRPDIVRCANCEVDLVKDLVAADPFSSTETMAEMLADKEVEAVFVGNHAHLKEWQTLLSERKIASVMAGESGNADAPVVNVHERLFLMVASEQIGAVRDIIKENWDAGLEVEGVMLGDGATSPEELGADTCPACGSAVEASAVECGECGLVVGAAEGEEEDGEPPQDKPSA